MFYKVEQFFYKVGQPLLQDGAAFVITKRVDFMTKRDRYYKVGR